MWPDQAVLKGTMFCCQKYQTAATKKNRKIIISQVEKKTEHCNQFSLTNVKARIMQTKPRCINHSSKWLHHLAHWSQQERKQKSQELPDIKTNSGHKLKAKDGAKQRTDNRAALTSETERTANTDCKHLNMSSGRKCDRPVEGSLTHSESVTMTNTAHGSRHTNTRPPHIISPSAV